MLGLQIKLGKGDWIMERKEILKREYTYNSKSVEPDSDSFDSVHHLVILCAKSVSVHNHCDCAFWIHRYY